MCSSFNKYQAYYCEIIYDQNEQLDDDIVMMLASDLKKSKVKSKDKRKSSATQSKTFHDGGTPDNLHPIEHDFCT
jgi:hypothetical protein